MDSTFTKWLKELVPTRLYATGRHGHLALAETVRGLLLAMSAAMVGLTQADAS